MEVQDVTVERELRYRFIVDAESDPVPVAERLDELIPGFRRWQSNDVKMPSVNRAALGWKVGKIEWEFPQFTIVVIPNFFAALQIVL